MTTLEKYHAKNMESAKSLKKSNKDKEFVFVRGAWGYIYSDKSMVQFAREDINFISDIYKQRGMELSVIEFKRDHDIYTNWRERIMGRV